MPYCANLSTRWRIPLCTVQYLPRVRVWTVLQRHVHAVLQRLYYRGLCRQPSCTHRCGTNANPEQAQLQQRGAGARLDTKVCSSYRCPQKHLAPGPTRVQSPPLLLRQVAYMPVWVECDWVKRVCAATGCTRGCGGRPDAVHEETAIRKNDELLGGWVGEEEVGSGVG